MSRLERTVFFLQESRTLADQYDKIVDFCESRYYYQKPEMKRQYLKFKTIELISSAEYDKLMENDDA